MVKMLYGLQAKLDRPLASVVGSMKTAIRIIVGIAIAPLVAAIAVGVLLSYGAWCASDFVTPKKDKNA